MKCRQIPLARFYVLMVTGMLQANCLPLAGQDLAAVPSDTAKQAAFKLIEEASKSASLTKQRKAVAEHALRLIEEAVDRDDFVAGEYLGQLALDSARRAKEVELTKRVVARNKAIKEMAEAYSEAKDFRLPRCNR